MFCWLSFWSELRPRPLPGEGRGFSAYKASLTCPDADSFLFLFSPPVWLQVHSGELRNIFSSFSLSFSNSDDCFVVLKMTKRSRLSQIKELTTVLPAGRSGAAAGKSGNSPGWSRCGGRRCSSSPSGAAAVRNHKDASSNLHRLSQIMLPISLQVLRGSSGSPPTQEARREQRDSPSAETVGEEEEEEEEGGRPSQRFNQPGSD